MGQISTFLYPYYGSRRSSHERWYLKYYFYTIQHFQFSQSQIFRIHETNNCYRSFVCKYPGKRPFCRCRHINGYYCGILDRMEVEPNGWHVKIRVLQKYHLLIRIQICLYPRHGGEWMSGFLATLILTLNRAHQLQVPAFITQESAPSTCWIRCWMGTGVGLDMWEDRNIFSPCRESKDDPRIQPVAISLYTLRYLGS